MAPGSFKTRWPRAKVGSHWSRQFQLHANERNRDDWFRIRTCIKRKSFAPAVGAEQKQTGRVVVDPVTLAHLEELLGSPEDCVGVSDKAHAAVCQQQKLFVVVWQAGQTQTLPRPALWTGLPLPRCS